jgi:hypothetical protein
MLTVVTTRPPSTYIFIPSLQFNSILEKLYFCCLMLKATKFFWCWILKFLFATSVVGATGGSWLEGAYVLTPLPTNRARIRRERKSLEEQNQNTFQSCLLLFLALCFSLSRTYRKRLKTLELAKSHSKKKKNTRATTSQCRNVVASYSAATTRAVTSQQREL